MIKIWVDADACPRAAKDLVFRAAERLGIETVLVANQQMRIPRSDFVSLEVVEAGANVADDFIVEHVSPGDLVIMEDIPLAARIVEQGAVGIDPRGLIYTEDNVSQKLASRNLLTELRDTGLITGGPAPYKDKDRAKFASALDRTLTKLLKASS